MFYHSDDGLLRTTIVAETRFESLDKLLGCFDILLHAGHCVNLRGGMARPADELASKVNYP